MKNRYKHILLDADNTLFDFDAAEKNAFLSLSCVDSEVFCEKNYDLYHKINDSAWKRLERGEITKARLKTLRFSELYAALSREVSDSTLSDIVTLYPKMLARGTALLDGALETVRRLSAEYDMYIITNGLSDVQRARFAASELRVYIKELFVSESIGFEKPSTQYFDFVLNAVGDCDRRNYIVVGDSLTSDIDGALSSGLDCVFFDKNGTGPCSRQPTYIIRKIFELADVVLCTEPKGF